MDSAKTFTGVDAARTMDDYRPGEAEGKIDIVIREKQTGVNDEIYYALEQE